MKLEIDNQILSSFNVQRGISVNAESTDKKLMYQVPFHEVVLLKDIIQKFEQEISDKVYIDVEMNTLEDAYINIAKQEE